MTGSLSTGTPMEASRLITSCTNGLFFLRSWCQHHPVCLQALLFADFQHALLGPGLVNQHTAEAKPRRSALLETKLNETARALENFGRKLAAILPSHRAFDRPPNTYGVALWPFCPS